jgi:hypothetical protein
MDEVVVSAASFLVIRLLGQEQERRRKKLPQKRRWWMTTVGIIPQHITLLHPHDIPTFKYNYTIKYEHLSAYGHYKSI